MKSKSHSNRGKSLEELVDYINQIYRKRKIAVIHKVPTEWAYINGRYFPRKKSIVDFLGIYKGHAIAFDTKETKNKTSFPLSNIHQHQYDYLEEFANLNGIAFYLVHFTLLRKIYIIMHRDLKKFIAVNSRKSLPLFWIQAVGIEVDTKNFDYLRHLEEW